MKFKEYKTGILKNKDLCDVIADGDLSIQTCIDELEKLGYRILKNNCSSIRVGQKVKVFNSIEWDKKRDIGDNSIYWQDAIIDKLIYKKEWLADVVFVKSKLKSCGHFVKGIRLI